MLLYVKQTYPGLERRVECGGPLNAGPPLIVRGARSGRVHARARLTVALLLELCKAQ